jgi:hypothetical protein
MDEKKAPSSQPTQQNTGNTTGQQAPNSNNSSMVEDHSSPDGDNEPESPKNEGKREEGDKRFTGY